MYTLVLLDLLMGPAYGLIKLRVLGGLCFLV